MLFIKWCKSGLKKKVKNGCGKSRDTDNTLVIMKIECLRGVDIEFKILMRKVKSLLKQTTTPSKFAVPHSLIHRSSRPRIVWATLETALLSLTHNWLKAMDNSKRVGSVFLNLSKAFDLMVSHDILLSEIAKYHVSQPTLRWFRSYLCDRTQTCAISGVLSDPLTLTQGVPQRSSLGPLSFSLYINDLPLCLPASDVDKTLWTSDHSIDNIQHNLQDSRLD